MPPRAATGAHYGLVARSFAGRCGHGHAGAAQARALARNSQIPASTIDHAARGVELFDVGSLILEGVWQAFAVRRYIYIMLHNALPKHVGQEFRDRCAQP